MSAAMDELFEQFLIEGRELIGRATDDLLALEQDGRAAGRVDSAFRAVHTLKGSVGIFDLAPMGAALHAAEDVLGAARTADEPMPAPVAQALLSCLDRCDRWMDAVEDGGSLPFEAAREAMRIASGLAALAGGASANETPSPQAPLWAEQLLAAEAERVDAAGATGPLVAIRYEPRADCFFTGDDPAAFMAAIPGLVALRIRPREPWPSLADIDPYHCNLLIEALSMAPLADIRAVFRYVPDQVELAELAASAAQEPEQLAVAEARIIRVEAARIDRLLDLVGELMVARNGLSHLALLAEAGRDGGELAAAIRANQALTDRAIADLHQTVMSVRLVPLDRLFRRIARTARDITARLGREVDLVIKGEGTRIDKAVADALFEPLLHLVRNAIDHGIELPASRRAQGKPAAGRLLLSARPVGEQIQIELADDGAGIDPARIRKAAAERGLVTAEAATKLEDDAAIQLIFAPGFSTASVVTDVSGRGMGMDAVRTAVERLSGRVTIASRRGAGTTMTLRLPASAALATLLVVTVADERFGIPVDVVAELVRLRAADVVPLGQGEAFVLRGRTLPLLRLASLLDLEADEVAGELNVLIVETVHGRIGVAVDAVSDRIDAMLRPMSGLMASIDGMAGTTLLGDGSVLLVLDIAELVG